MNLVALGIWGLHPHFYRPIDTLWVMWSVLHMFAFPPSSLVLKNARNYSCFLVQASPCIDDGLFISSVQPVPDVSGANDAYIRSPAGYPTQTWPHTVTEPPPVSADPCRSSAGFQHLPRSDRVPQSIWADLLAAGPAENGERFDITRVLVVCLSN